MAQNSLQNLEAERSVLGGILNGALDVDDVAGRVNEDAFTDQQHRNIYRAILAIYEQGNKPDLVAVSEQYDDVQLLSGLIGSVYTGYLQQHVDVLEDLAIRRGLQKTCAELASKASDRTLQATSMLDQAQHAIMDLSPSRSGNLVKVSSVTKDVLSSLEQGPNQNSVPTGYTHLDCMTGGLHPTNLTILAARPAMGKTAFASNLMFNISAAGAPVLFFSLEMARDQIVKRLISQKSTLPHSIFRQGLPDGDQRWIEIEQTVEMLQGLPFYIDDTPGMSIYDLRSRARKAKKSHGIQAIVVDYLTKVRPSRKRETRDMEVTDIAADLKALARELNVPVVALAQLNREVEKRTNKRPTLADLRESGGIEQEADEVLFLYREAAYNPTCGHNRAEVKIGKQRNGETGSVELAFIGERISFEGLERGYEYE